VIIVTNQPQVARGLCSKKDVEEINAYVVLELQKKGAKIDAVFYCPHHPDFQKDPCQCRKPNIEMLVEAKESFDLDMKKCYMVGDSTRDIKTGKNAGCKTILVKTGHAGTDGKYDVKPDAICRNILEAANRILDGRV
jgi:histidinol-phosphate phosphatase family protein